jgi:DNA-binding LacI/PurR family transcriptional regulator
LHGGEKGLRLSRMALPCLKSAVLAFEDVLQAHHHLCPNSRESPSQHTLNTWLRLTSTGQATHNACGCRSKAISQAVATMAVTLKDISREAGVDIATVSRALNGSYGVHEDTRERILRIAKRLNYRVNLMAKGLAEGRSRTIGVLVAAISDPSILDQIRGVEDAAYAAGYQIVLCNSYLDVTREALQLHSLLERRVEGILIHSVEALNKAEVTELVQADVPVVLFHQIPGTSDFSSVCMNQFEGGFLAGKHLVDLGHRRIAFLSGPRGHGNFVQRIKGFLKAARSSKQDVTPVVIHGQPDFEGGYQMAKELLKKNHRATAIFAANDMTAFGISNAIFEAGLSIPEDISLVGFGNVELTKIVRPPLTTIHHPKYEMGKAAVEIMLGLAKKGGLGVPEHREFGIRLVTRSSTGPPPKARS